METIQLIGTILGGLGLFLLAIGMMTDGLKLAAGSALRTMLSKWSRTPLRGIFSGYLMTAIVQSSSAVTVASLGFVNAGLITMRQTLGIIYGANIGTTMTGWLVALIGFKLNIQAFALPMIGIGMILKLIKPNDKLASFGIALVGFGLFFVGIDILKVAFEGVVQTFDISQYTAEGLMGIINCLIIGVIMTILTQSSSASIALTITAASSDIVGVYAAAAMVVGANVGTTSTALLASIGATSNAKRVATAQVIFNVGTALVALLILPVLFYLINGITTYFNIEANPAISLAIFHTVFNVLGVILIYPQNDRLAKFLEQRFKSREEQESRPRFLDKTIAQTPVLAVNALMRELQSISDRIIVLFNKIKTSEPLSIKTCAREISVLKSLSSEVSTFIVNIESAALHEETSTSLSTLMRVEQYFLTCTTSAHDLIQILEKRECFTDKALEQQTNQYFEDVLTYMEMARANTFESPEDFHALLKNLSSQHDDIKAKLINAATRSNITVGQMSSTLDALAEVLQVAQMWFKAFTRLHALALELSHTEA